MSNYQHILLYDGLCVLCNKFNTFVLQRDPNGKFAFASLQSNFAKTLLLKCGCKVNDLNTIYCIVDYGTSKERILSQASVGIFILEELGGFWSIASILKIFPVTVLNAVYNLIARNRYKIFGRYETCLLPDDRWKGRFLDVDTE